MKNKVIATIKEVSPMGYEVSYELVGDGMKWLKKNKQRTQAMDVLDKAEENQVDEIMYESKLEKKVKQLSKMKDVEVVR